MREIKFRAWDKKEKVMLPVSQLGMDIIELVIWLDAMQKTLPYKNIRENYIFPQYTGLKDKKGKKIYEGDVVRILYTDWASKSEDDVRTLEQYLIDIAHLAKVVYRGDGFYLEAKDVKYGGDYYGSIYPGTHGYIEIIGNIYENPELCKPNTK